MWPEWNRLGACWQFKYSPSYNNKLFLAQHSHVLLVRVCLATIHSFYLFMSHSTQGMDCFFRCTLKFILSADKVDTSRYFQASTDIWCWLWFRSCHWRILLIRMLGAVFFECFFFSLQWSLQSPVVSRGAAVWHWGAKCAQNTTGKILIFEECLVLE